MPLIAAINPPCFQAEPDCKSKDKHFSKWSVSLSSYLRNIWINLTSVSTFLSASEAITWKSHEPLYNLSFFRYLTFHSMKFTSYVSQGNAWKHLCNQIVMKFIRSEFEWYFVFSFVLKNISILLSKLQGDKRNEAILSPFAPMSVTLRNKSIVKRQNNRVLKFVSIIVGAYFGNYSSIWCVMRNHLAFKKISMKNRT